MLNIHDAAGIERLFLEHRANPEWLRSLRTVFYKRLRGPTEALATLPESHRSRLARQIEFHSLELQDRVDSGDGRATKLLFRTARGWIIESVILRIASGRTALCVSSQVGCAANCAFCATGKMGLAVDLTAGEILDQVVQANHFLRGEGRSVRNVVFMGMGEPLHNERALTEALGVLHSPRCFDHPARYVSVSTVGIPTGMVRLADRFPRTHIALSLHSAVQEVRERIVPLARRYPLAELRRTLEQICEGHGKTVMIEYLLLQEVNDGERDLLALIDYLRGLRVLINLIPYNPIEGAPDLLGTPRPAREAFAARLKRAGFQVTLRHSLGADIGAACGQLVQRENRGLARRQRGD